MPKTPDRPDWNNADDIVVPEQRAIRVFENSRGNVVILQQADDPHHEDDPLIEIRPENVAAVIEALKGAAGLVDGVGLVR